MGLFDKAKQLADQAQSKLDEVQKDRNAGQGTAGGAEPAVQYDQHGRPLPAEPATAVPSGVPPAPADKSPRIDPDTPTSPDPEPAKRHGDPLLNDEPGSRHGPPPTPPGSGSGLSSGDPLAG